MQKRALRSRLLAGGLLTLFVVRIGVAQDKAYPVEHLPMLEKRLCYVWIAPGTEYVLPNLLAALETDAVNSDKQKSLSIVSQTVNDQLILEAKRHIQGGLQRVSVQRNNPEPTIITEMIKGEGARFVFVNTKVPSNLPQELVGYIKEVSKGRVNLAELPADAAGFQVCWQWKQKGKKNQMWVILYAPGPYTLINITARCLKTVAHAGGNNIREPGDIIPVSRWAYVVDKEIATNPAFQGFHQWLMEWLSNRVAQGGSWIEPKELPNDTVPPETVQEIEQGQWNCVAFLLQKNIALFLQQVGNIFAPLREELRTLRATEVAVIASSQNPYRVCYVAATPALLRRAIISSGDFANPKSAKFEVPDLSWIRRISIVFTKNAKALMPEGARNRLIQELKAGLTFWQIYDETVLQNILKLEEIGLQGLPGGAAPAARAAPIDAMLVIDVNRYQQNAPTWKEVSEWRFQSLTGEWVRWNPSKGLPPSKLADPPFGAREPSPHGSLFRKPPPPEQWLEQHAAWWQQKEELKQYLRQNEYSAEVDMACVEEVNAEISCALIDMRATSSKYGTPVSPELVLPSVHRRSTHTRDQGTRRGRFRYQFVEAAPENLENALGRALSAFVESSGQKQQAVQQMINEALGSALKELLTGTGEPGVYHGRRYMALTVQLIPQLPRWENLPQYPPDPNSPAVTEVSGQLARELHAWIEERALFDPTMKAPPPLPPDYVGKVSQSENNQLTVLVDGIQSPIVGDWIEVRCKDGSLPKAQVVSVNNNTLTARLLQPSANIQNGDEVFLTAPPPTPTPPKIAGSTSLDSIRVQNEIVVAIPLKNKPTPAQIESLKQKALKEAASKQAQAIYDKHKVKVDPNKLLKLATIASHQWNARTKQYVVRVRFSGTLSLGGD